MDIIYTFVPDHHTSMFCWTNTYSTRYVVSFVFAVCNFFCLFFQFHCPILGLVGDKNTTIDTCLQAIELKIQAQVVIEIHYLKAMGAYPNGLKMQWAKKVLERPEVL